MLWEMYLYHEKIFVTIMQILCRTLPERFILSVCLLLPSPVCGSEGCRRVVFCCFLPSPHQSSSSVCSWFRKRARSLSQTCKNKYLCSILSSLQGKDNNPLCLCLRGVFVCEVRVGECRPNNFWRKEWEGVCPEDPTPSALTFVCIYSVGRHTRLICSRSVAVLPLYIAICSILSHAIDMCMSILWSVYILPAHLPPPSLMHLSVRRTYIVFFLNSSKKWSHLFPVCPGKG